MKQPPPTKLETALIQVNNKSDSLKTTVPKMLIDIFELQKGDTINWIYNPRKNSIRIEIPPSNRNNGGGG
jgi:hypothetical protein